MALPLIAGAAIVGPTLLRAAARFAPKAVRGVVRAVVRRGPRVSPKAAVARPTKALSIGKAAVRTTAPTAAIMAAPAVISRGAIAARAAGTRAVALARARPRAALAAGAGAAAAAGLAARAAGGGRGGGRAGIIGPFGLEGPDDSIIAYSWDTGTAEFHRLIDGSIAVQRANGLWKRYRPARHIVVPKNPRIGTLLRADRQTDMLVNALAKRAERRRRRRTVNIPSK